MVAPRPQCGKDSGRENMFGDPSRSLELRRDWLGLTEGICGHICHNIGTWPGRKCKLRGTHPGRKGSRWTGQQGGPAGGLGNHSGWGEGLLTSLAEGSRGSKIQTLMEKVPGPWSLAEPSGKRLQRRSRVMVPGEVPCVRGWVAQRPFGRLPVVVTWPHHGWSLAGEVVRQLRAVTDSDGCAEVVWKRGS